MPAFVERKSFSKSLKVATPPDFLSVQFDSFNNFFQLETPPENRKNEGLYKVFVENFPITNSKESYILEFIDYSVEAPKYQVQECIDRGLTYSVALKARLRLSCNDEENEDFKTIEQEVFLGNIPYMTTKGSFIINGAERVIVSQLHRSPGVFFNQTLHSNGAKIYSARIIPFKGSWMEFATDNYSVMYAYIDRKKKFPLTTLLRAIGFGSDKEILELFELSEELKVNKKNLKKAVGHKLASRVLRSWHEDFVDEDTGEISETERYEVIMERNETLTEEDIDKVIETGMESINIQKKDVNPAHYAIIYNTLQKDNSNSEKEAISQIYRQLRNSDPPDDHTAREVINGLFFSDKRYDLGEVGRYRINKKLDTDIPIDVRVLTKSDIVSIIKYLIHLINSNASIDDIDHLSNRRVSTVGEQLYSQFGVGLSRMSRTIKERMNVRDNEDFKPVDLVNSRTLVSLINTFFGTNPLSQFMDQTNLLAEVTHKRRVSALGPGGLSRERAGFEVRDVHYTHYGRLCTIETPEGPNIGLISSLCIYAKVNKMGYIETPYYEVKNGKVSTDELCHLSAEEEDGHYIAQANTPINRKGEFISQSVKTHFESDFPIVDKEEVSFIDVAPNQIVSVAASLIPFLEHDDANRALMGSNMQRQAVSLLEPEAPIVGTGVEAQVATDSRSILLAEYDGKVQFVDANEIHIKYDLPEEEKLLSFDDKVTVYKLPKFTRTNQDTCINLRPLVKKKQKVKKGDILCDGASTQKGELALGRNLMVAFMPWQGYNFEDAIVISEKVVREDIFTSIHIEVFEAEARETKRGPEELTREIPNLSEDALKNISENGVIRVGSYVKENDILFGKITPKAETDPTPEEKLLKAIFGDKAGDLKDASIKAPPSMRGVVIDSKTYTRLKKDAKYKARVKTELQQLDEEYNDGLRKLKNLLKDKFIKILKGKTSNKIQHKFGEEVLREGVIFDEYNIQETFFPAENPFEDESSLEVPEESNLTSELILNNWTEDPNANDNIRKTINNYLKKRSTLMSNYKRKRISLEVGDELDIGIIEKSKIYIAKKRKLKVGDKMAGRHGNKGVIAKIIREEDMPFLEDGSPIDIVLNPLGVPSRMNLGQIYETILGWAGKRLGKTYATPIFDGATEEEIENELRKANLPSLGRTYLYDGITGRRFDQKVTVGVIYMLKLGHLVDDKVHARSIGSYSLITQQPLGGKAQFGGQRFGEMEVWALEAFGAAHILQEVLTVKSDDTIGRSKVYESIVKGEAFPEPHVPESFYVLVHELRGLTLQVTID